MADKEDDLSYLNGMEGGDESEEVTLPAELVEEPENEEAEPEEEPAAGEAEPEEEPEEEPSAGAVSEAPIAQRKRGETRIQKLANERTTEREGRIRAEAERDALLKIRPAAQTVDNGEAIRLRNEKLGAMEPQERAIFLQSEQIDKMNQQLLLTELRSEDRADRAAYDAKALVDKRYARNKDSVETKLKEFRAKGINATREQCLIQVIGEIALNEKPRKGAREAAGQRVASTRGTPTTSKGAGAAPASTGDDLPAIESRLKGKVW